jgi:hypothetical protein
VPSGRSGGESRRRASGGRPGAADYSPILDRLESRAGFVIATASGHGFGLCPAIGKVVSELVTKGTSSIPVERLSLSRFASLEPSWRQGRRWDAGRVQHVTGKAVGEDMANLKQRLASGELLILDGAIGTELQRLAVHERAWCAVALRDHIDTVRQLHEDYIRAGADVITVNTFSSARYVLEPAGLGPLAHELNTRAVALAVEARKRAKAGRSTSPASCRASACRGRTPTSRSGTRSRSRPTSRRAPGPI